MQRVARPLGLPSTTTQTMIFPICLLPVQGGNSILFQNSGSGPFTNSTAFAGLSNISANEVAFGDIANDGDLDLLVSGRLSRNNGNDTFTNVSAASGVTANGFANLFSDFDQDGFLDIFMAGFGQDPLVLYQNNSNGTFQEIATQAGLVGNKGAQGGGAVSDYDGDGDIDIYLAYAGDLQYTVGQTNVLYRNNGDGTFSDVTSSAGVGDAGIGNSASFGDLNNDGYPELFVSNEAPTSSVLYLNNGDGTFSDITSSSNLDLTGSIRSALFGDFENDGFLDVFLVRESGGGRLYRNNGDATFTDVTESATVDTTSSGIGGALGDYDRDGDLDVYISNSGSGNVLYQNEGNQNHWLNIKLVGTTSNASAIGAKIGLLAKLAGSGNPVWQYREISEQSGGRGGQGSLNAEFGLARATIVDSITINWPGGTFQALTNRPVDQFLVIEENRSNRDPRLVSEITDLVLPLAARRLFGI